MGTRLMAKGRRGSTWRALVCLACGPAAASGVTIKAHVAQDGDVSGIRNTVFTRWLPPGAAFAGLSGRIALRGNAPGFDEALVVLGSTPEDRAACLRRDGSVVGGVPVMDRLWAGILKSNDPSEVSMQAGFALPVPAALPEAGRCLVTLVSAGYPFLRHDAALYAATDVALSAAIAAGGQAVQAFGIGGEWRFATGAAAPMATYVGLRAERALVVDGVAAAVSAAAVAGAPAASGWVAPRDAAWRVQTSFAFVPAAACRAARYAGHPASAAFSVLRSPDPAPVRPPAASVSLLQVPLAGRGAGAAQAGVFSRLAGPGWSARLLPGDCLVAFQSVPAGGVRGTLDVENQSTLYFRDAAAR